MPANLSRRNLLVSLPLLGRPLVRAAQRDPPNILFILADDLGWPAVRCYGGRHARTPHLDRLASEGVRFNSAYVTPQCTPTRSSLLTGQQTARNRMWHVIPPYSYPRARMTEPPYRANLDRGTPTIAASLRGAGYETGIIGKWHLTANPQDGYYEQIWPEAATHFGFDWAEPRHNPQGVHQRTDKGVNYFTEQAMQFIARKRDRPFFLYLAHHTIHGPVLAPEALTKTYRDRGYLNEGLHNTTYLAALAHMDASVGRLLAHLDELKLRENTVVVFLSDNGGVRTLFDNSPLRSGKGSAYEGGIRVPCIMRWPGAVRPGTVSDAPVHVVDWFPTMLEMARAAAPASHPLDGISIVPHLRDGSLPRRRLYWYMPLYDPQWGAVPAAVIRDGDEKLIEFFGDYIDIDHDYDYTTGHRLELYNLKQDMGERANLASRQRGRAEKLHGQLRSWLKEMDAPLPELNQNYDAANPLGRG